MSLIIVLIIPLVAQSAPVTDIRNKRQSPPSSVALGSAVTEYDRQIQLADNDYVYDFANAKTGVLSGKGGHLNLATASNFPALIGHGIGMAVVTLTPCGLDGPVYHPRSTEFDYVVSGTLRVGFIQDGGARVITNIVSAGQATLIPQGAIHFLQNLNCTDAVFVAALNSADPGLFSVADVFLNKVPSDIVAASAGVNQTIIENIKSNIGAIPTLGIQECRQRCNIS